MQMNLLAEEWHQMEIYAHLKNRTLENKAVATY